MKELEAFYYLMNIYGLRGDGYEKYQLVEKSLKALEIIINKSVNISYFKSCLFYNQTDEQGLKDYNMHFGCNDDGDYTNKLTKIEFDLLKDVLL